MENSYLIPANSKRGNLIFNWFRPIDLIIFGSGIVLTLFCLIFLGSNNSMLMFMYLIPAGIGAALVMPVPNQHNILVLLGAIIKFYTSQQRYKWKGWKFHEDFK